MNEGLKVIEDTLEKVTNLKGVVSNKHATIEELREGLEITLHSLEIALQCLRHHEQQKDKAREVFNKMKEEMTLQDSLPHHCQ